MKFIPKIIDYSKYTDPSKRSNPKPQCDCCEHYFVYWSDLTEIEIDEREYNYCENCLEYYEEEMWK